MCVFNFLNVVDFRIGCIFIVNCDFLLVWIVLFKNYLFYLFNMLFVYYKNKFVIGSFFYLVFFLIIFG